MKSYVNSMPAHRGGSRGRVEGVRIPLPPEMKPSSYSLLKFVYLTGQWRYSLEVLPPDKNTKILDPPWHRKIVEVPKHFMAFLRTLVSALTIHVVVFLEATKVNNSNNTKWHFASRLYSHAHTHSLGHMTTVHSPGCPQDTASSSFSAYKP